MMLSRRHSVLLARWTAAATLAIGIAAAIAPVAAAEPPTSPPPASAEPPASAQPAASAQPPACEWEIEYALSANLWLTDTPFAQGDGIYSVGPGKLVLRFEDRGGRPGGRVTLVAHELHEHFTASSKLIVWRTSLVTDAVSRITVDACGAAAEGTLTGHTLAWSTPVRGYRTDGTMLCSGLGCGGHGVPRSGRSELHLGPGPLTLRSFAFADDMKTFSMPYTFGAKTDLPKQTSHVALGGREVRRACVPARVCRK